MDAAFAFETCSAEAKSSAENLLHKTVVILERYRQLRGADGDLLFNTSYREAANAMTQFTSEGTNHPSHKSVRFWQGEALSHFKKSAWEGEFVLTPVVWNL